MRRHPTMVRQVKEYLRLRRSLGFELQSQGEMLLSFAKYLDRSGHRGPLTTEVALRWTNLPKNASRAYRAKRLSAVRCFARYLTARDGRTEVPDQRLVSKVYLRQRPHLYSQSELEQLLAATGRLWPSYPLKWLVYRTLFGLLACTGLRVSEALKLSAADVNLDHGVLRIEKTKFKKSRLVPLHATATRALRRYVQARYRQQTVGDDMRDRWDYQGRGGGDTAGILQKVSTGSGMLARGSHGWAPNQGKSPIMTCLPVPRQLSTQGNSVPLALVE